MLYEMHYRFKALCFTYAMLVMTCHLVNVRVMIHLITCLLAYAAVHVETRYERVSAPCPLEKDSTTLRRQRKYNMNRQSQPESNVLVHESMCVCYALSQTEKREERDK